jgi:hypothetical protein
MTDHQSDFDDPDKFMMVLRSGDEVAARCIILCCVVAHSEDPSLSFEGWLKAEQLWEKVSPKEKQFLLNNTPSEREVKNASWRSEAVLTLLWSLGLIREMPLPVQTESFAAMLQKVPGPDEATADFIGTAKVRPLDEIASTYEVVYDQHWRVRDAQMNGTEPPPGLERGVIYERHYTLNWLRRYGIFEEQEWDEITTDT